MIKLISFDLDGTLVDNHTFDNIFWFQEIPRIYAEEKGVSLEEAKVLTKKAFKEADSTKAFWYRPSYWFDFFKFKADVQKVVHDLKDGIKLFPEVVEVLTKLGQKYEMIVVTHSTKEFVELKMQVENIDKHFSYVYSTIEKFNAVKKNGDVFKQIMEMHNVKPSEVLHVGDHEKYDFEVPRKMGIKSVLLDRTGEKTGEDVISDLREIEKFL